VKQPTPALSKYARGQYAVCARCGCRPCACADSAPGDELRVSGTLASVLKHEIRWD
jgi:hypothetical protein